MREGLRLTTLSQRTPGKYESSSAFKRAKRKRGLARGEEGGEVFAVEQEVSKEKEFDYEQCPDSGALVLFQNGEVDAGEKSNEEDVDHFLLQNEEAAYAEAAEQKGVSNLFIKGPNKRKGRRGRPKKVDQQSSSLTLMLQNQEILDREGVEIEGPKKLKRGRGRPKKVDQQIDALNSMVQNQVAVYREGAELKKGVSRGLKMLKQGRGRPKKVDHENDALFPEVAETKKGVSRRLTKGIKMLKPGRGRPKKVDRENDALSLMLLDQEPAEIKKGVSKGRKKVKGRRGRPRKVNQVNDALSSTLQNVDAAEVVVKKKKQFEGQYVRPEKDNKENDGHMLVNQEEEDMEGAVTVKPTEELDQSVEAKRIELNDCCETLQKVEKKNDDSKMATCSGSNGTEAPSYGSKLKRKRFDKEDESVSNSKLSGKVPNSRRAASEVKNALRNQIVEMLTSAGWRVEHRPRKGRAYMDAVYVSPEGRTHWSVTLAYKKFKKEVEKSKASSGSGNTNSLFKPIPEEQLRLLYRIQVEKRGSGKEAKLKTTENSKQKKSTLKSGGKSVVRKVENSIAFPRKRKPSSVQSKTQKKRHCGLQVRRSGQMVNASSDAFLSPSGKHSVLSWMIDSGCVQDDEKVHYRVGTKTLLEGNITRDGICCGCCGKVISVAEFEKHSGSGLYQTYENLFLENGSSLLQCQIDSWNKLDESIRMGFHRVNVDMDDPNDDSCGLCGDGGDLVCCDGCPSTFHQGCLNIEDFPSGEWSCVYCSCKYCGTVRRDVDEEDGDTQLEQKDGESASSLLTCHLCDEKYHQMCAEDKEVGRVCCKGPTFCGKSCEQVFERLQNLMGIKAEIGDGFTCTLIKRAHIDANLPSTSMLTVAERISKLAAVQSVMDECFLPIIDHRSGINLIRHTVYSCGSNFKRLNFQGFFTAILEKEDETIAAASIRIHGEKLAEMPFIGTRITYRRQGMCRRLLSGIESALRSLNIEKLIIPAVSEVLETWTKVFGFTPFGKCRDEMRHMNIIQFPFTDILHKPLLNLQFMDAVPENNATLGSFGSKDPMAEGQSNTVIRMDGDCLSNGHDDSQTRSLHCAQSSPEEEWFDPPETIPSDMYECKAEVISSEGVHVDEVNVLTDVGIDGCLDGDSAPVVLSSNKGNMDVNSTLVLDSVCDVDKCKAEVISSEGVHVDEANVSIDGCLEENSARFMLSSNKGILDVNFTQIEDSVFDVDKCKAEVLSSEGVRVVEANVTIDGCLEEDSACVMLSSNKGIFDVDSTLVEYSVCDVDKCKAEVISSKGVHIDEANVSIDGCLEEDSAHVMLSSNKGILDVNSTQIEDAVCDVDKCKAEAISCEGVPVEEANVLTDVGIDGCLDGDSAPVMLFSNNGILDVNPILIEDSFCDVDKCKAEVISCEGEEANVSTDVGIGGWLDGDSAPVMLFSNNGILDVNPTLIEDSFCDVDKMKASSSLLACDRAAYGNYANVGMCKLSEDDSNVNGMDGCEMKNNKLSPGLIASGRTDCEEHTAGSVDVEHGQKVMQRGDTDDVDVTIDCNDRSFLDNVNFQPNSNLDCSELDIEVVHLSDSACEGDARSRIPTTEVVNDLDSSFKGHVISDNVVDVVVTGLGSSLEQDLTANCSGVNRNDSLVEKGAGYISTDNGQMSTEVAWNDGQFLEGLLITAEESVISSKDDFLPNGAQVDANTTSEVGEPNKQAECKIMTPSSSCNLSSGSMDISAPGGFHTCGIPEVGSK